MEALAQIATPEFVFAFMITFTAATLQSTVGFGFALISVPILELLNPVFAPVPQLVAVIPLTVVVVIREWHAVDPRSTAWIFAGRIPGAFLGVILLKLLATGPLDVLMASMVGVGLALVVGSASFRRTRTSEFVAGVASGTMAMVSAIGGPPIAILYGKDRGPTVRANLGLVFAIGVCITLSVRTLAGEVTWTEVMIGLAFIPAVLLGVWASRGLLTRVEGSRLRNAIVTVASASALVLFVRGVLNW
ncbi:MAG: sulfite exporter TauE/SafE family protein [Polyangiales bacterium]